MREIFFFTARSVLTFNLCSKRNRNNAKFLCFRFYPVTKPRCSSISQQITRQPLKKKTRHSQHPPLESHVGWVLGSREHTASRDRLVKCFEIFVIYKAIMKYLVYLSEDYWILKKFTLIISFS